MCCICPSSSGTNFLLDCFCNFHEIDTHDRSIALVMKLRSKLKIRKPATLACYRKYEHLLHLASHLLLNYVRWDQFISHPPIFKRGDNIGVNIHFRGCKLLKQQCWYNLNFWGSQLLCRLSQHLVGASSNLSSFPRNVCLCCALWNLIWLDL